MSYKLNKPCNDIQRADFIVEYNHNQNLRIEETEEAIYALEENEMMGEENGIQIPVVNPAYLEQKASEREENFEREFFSTSLGWIRRKVNMKDGSIRDFLADLLLPIKAGLELGQKVEIITYKTPDFTQEQTAEYIISLQERKEATAEFIQECLMQTVMDFGG